MSIFEYDEEKHLKSEREIAYNDGFAHSQEQIIKSMLKQNISIEQISKMCSIPFETVEKISKEIQF